MNIPQFLAAISDDQGVAHKISARHAIHTMSQEDFEELISEMKKPSQVIVPSNTGGPDITWSIYHNFYHKNETAEQHPETQTERRNESEMDAPAPAPIGYCNFTVTLSIMTHVSAKNKEEAGAAAITKVLADPNAFMINAEIDSVVEDNGL